jgi:agmatine deiminase
VRVPLPRLITGTLRPGDGVYDLLAEMEYADGSDFPKGKPIRAIAAASYLNFLIANDAVLVPRYGTPGGDAATLRRDAEAHAILQQVFPDRKIVPINALAVNWGGGGIHCITMNEPKIR